MEIKQKEIKQGKQQKEKIGNTTRNKEIGNTT